MYILLNKTPRVKECFTFLPAPGPGNPGHEVHEEGEEGEGRGEQGVLVKELDQVVQPRIPASRESQSRQSAKLFSSRRNWDSPNTSPAGECAPLFGSGGRGKVATNRGGGRVSIPMRRHILWYSIYRIYILCAQNIPMKGKAIYKCSLFTLLPKYCSRTS